MQFWRSRGCSEKTVMKNINFALTLEELRLLSSLASDQLFRRQYIDPKMPGYKGSPEEVAIGKALVCRMRLIMDETANAASSSLRDVRSR